MFHNMKRLNSVSQHTECYYFNDKKMCNFPCVRAVKSVHINKGTTVQPGKKAARETHFIQVMWGLVSDQKAL